MITLTLYRAREPGKSIRHATIKTVFGAARILKITKPTTTKKKTAVHITHGITELPPCNHCKQTEEKILRLKQGIKNKKNQKGKIALISMNSAK